MTGTSSAKALTRTFPFGEIEPFQTPVFRKPEKPSLLNAHIPPWLEAVLLRAIEAKPENCYEQLGDAI